jgi:hypothetical protein
LRIAALVACAVLFAEGSARADTDDPFDVGTVTGQAGIGAATGAVGCAGVGLLGAGIGSATNGYGGMLGGAFVGCVIGGTVGMVLAVNYLGDTQGANGTLLGTSLGMITGVIVFGSAQVIAEVGYKKDIPGVPNVLLGIATLIGGPVIGYHLTADKNGGRVSVPILSVTF